jgi:SpoVK/Ycf46/Vps4 family AAA+-type ATPase
MFGANGMARKRSSGGELSQAEDSAGGQEELDFDLDLSIRYDRKLITPAKEHDPFSSLFYSPEVIQHVEDAKTWLAQETWYKKRGIPWRRGVLWHGPAGTGKSSIVRAIAEVLGLPLYVYHLSTLSDQEFIEQWNSMETPCIALFEDIDTVFNLREALTPHKALTFECLLNTISGVKTLSGTLLMVTTNHLDKVDHALRDRPGRIDVTVEVGAMKEAQRRKLAQMVLMDWPDLVEPMVIAGEEMTPVRFQEMCIKRALSELAKSNGLPTNVVPLKQAAQG